MIKKISLVFGVVFAAVGLLGFVMNPILGIFATDALHNVVHLLTGVVALYFGIMGSEAAAAMFLKVFGAVYALVAVLGFTVVTDGKILGLIQTNTADNWLHVVLAAALLGSGFMFGGKGMPSSTMVPPSSPMSPSA